MGEPISTTAPNPSDSLWLEELTTLKREVGFEPDAVVGRAAEIHEAARGAGAAEVQVRAGLLLADACYRLGRVDEARRHLGESVDLAVEVGDPPLLAEALIVHCSKLGDLGRTAEALEAGMRARQLASGVDSVLEARAASVISWALVRAHDTERALVWADLAVELADATTDRRSRFLAHNVRAAVVKEAGDPSTARTMFLHALRVGGDVLDPSSRGAALGNIGNCLRDLGQPEEAMRYLERALECTERAGHAVNRAGLLMMIGRARLKDSDVAGAVHYFERAVPALDALGHKVWLHNCLAALSEAYAQQGAHDSAFHTLRRSVEVERACIIEQRSTDVDALQARQDEAAERRLREELARALVDVEAARAKAEAHAEAISAFLALTSHEIRTPLTGVLGLADLLAEEPLPAALKENVEMIRTSGRIVLGVVNDILDFNKLAAGRMELDPVPCSLPQVLHDAIWSFVPRVAERDLALVLDLEAGLPKSVVTDDRRLAQVVGNLLSNSVRFTEDGEITVAASSVGPTRVRIEVRDTGPGVAPDAAARLFRPFVQQDRHTAREHGGSGLGLAICRQLVELFCGDIGAQGEKGKGTTVWFEVELDTVTSKIDRRLVLPLHDGARLPLLMRQPVVKRECRRLQGRVLVVEDNIINQRVVTGLLRALGVTCVVVEDGLQGVEAGVDPELDIILMDGELPHMDGWEATRRLRALGVDIPIYALTASLVDEVRDRCDEAGMTGIITKPVTREALTEALGQHLEAAPT